MWQNHQDDPNDSITDSESLNSKQGRALATVFCLFVCLFVLYLGCLSRTFTIHKTAVEVGGDLFYSSLPLPLALGGAGASAITDKKLYVLSSYTANVG